MASRTPPEVWHTVLKYTISVPIFFDPDAIQSFPTEAALNDYRLIWNDERPYWRSERTRNVLQRVCRSWDIFLRRYEHRFLRTIDVLHGHVPEVAMTRAIRVFYNEGTCHCRRPRGYNGGQFDISSYKRAESRFRRVADHGVHLAMEIAVIWAKSGPELYLFDEYASSLSNLVTLSISEASSGQSLGAAVSHLPKLRHIYGRGYWGEKEKSHFDSPHLVTLSFNGQDLTISDYEPSKWKLPSLQHLYMKCNSMQPEQELALLRVLGVQLLSLEWLSYYHKRNLPEEIWDLCPKLQRFRTNLLLKFPPPPMHPIQSLHLDYSEYRAPSDTPFPEWPMLREIVIGKTWGASYATKLGLEERWMQECKKRKIQIKDMNGETLEAYTLRTGYWFDRSGIRRKPTPYTLPLPPSPVLNGISLDERPTCLIFPDINDHYSNSCIMEYSD